MIYIFTMLFFVLGLVVGSFLNVVICRFNTSRTLVSGRSMCMSCQHGLCWYELIPFFSFLALGGRCLVCKSRISKMYPLVELITGVLFMLLFYKFQNLFFIDLLSFVYTYLYYGVIMSLLVVIAFYDFRHKIIPDELSLLLGVVSFMGLFMFQNFYLDMHLPDMSQVSAGFMFALPFFFLWLLSRGTWMGLGDAKLAIGLGWWLGLYKGLAGLVVSFWLGAIISVVLIVFTKKYTMKSEIPFAPFLVLGSILAFFLQLNIFPNF